MKPSTAVKIGLGLLVIRVLLNLAMVALMVGGLLALGLVGYATQ
jgi:hypothetical protein